MGRATEAHGAQSTVRNTEEELAVGGNRAGTRAIADGRTHCGLGRRDSHAAFREGRVRLQDEGSQLVAELVPRGNAILDCCAAPGGKTLILAERNPEARIVACESSPQRLAQLQNGLQRWANASSAGLLMRPRLKTRLTTTSCWPMCLAAAPVRWAAIRRFAIGCAGGSSASGRPAAGDSSCGFACCAAWRARGLFHLFS